MSGVANVEGAVSIAGTHLEFEDLQRNNDIRLTRWDICFRNGQKRNAVIFALETELECLRHIYISGEGTGTLHPYEDTVKRFSSSIVFRGRSNQNSQVRHCRLCARKLPELGRLQIRA